MVYRLPTLSNAGIPHIYRTRSTSRVDNLFRTLFCPARLEDFVMGRVCTCTSPREGGKQVVQSRMGR